MDGDQPLDLSKGSPSKSGSQQSSAAASQSRPPRPAAYTPSVASQPQVPLPHDKQYGSQPSSLMYTHRVPAGPRPIGPHQLLHHHGQPQGGAPVGFAVPDRRALGIPGVDTKAGGTPHTHPPPGYTTSAMGRPAVGQHVDMLDGRQPYHPAVPMRSARSPVAPHSGTERTHNSQAPVRMPMDSRLMMGAAESSIRAINPASHNSATLIPIAAPVADLSGVRRPRKGMPSSQSPNRMVAYSADTLQRVQLSVSAQPVPANPSDFVTLRQCLVENRRLDGSQEVVNSPRTSQVVAEMAPKSPRIMVSEQGDRHLSTSSTATGYTAQPTQHYPPDVINRLNRGMPHPAFVAVQQRQPNFHPSMAMQQGPRLSSPPPLIHAPRSSSAGGQKDDATKSSVSSESDQKRPVREMPPQAADWPRAAQMVQMEYPPPPPYVHHRQAHHIQGMQNSSEAAYKDRTLPQYTTARQQQEFKGYPVQGLAVPPRVSTSEAASVPVQQFFMPAAHLSPRSSLAHRQANGDVELRRVQGELRSTSVAHPPPLISVAGSVTNASFMQRGGTLTVSAQGSRGIPATSVHANVSGYLPQPRDGVTGVAQIVEKEILDDGRQAGRPMPPAWRHKHRPVYQQVNGIPIPPKVPETSKINIPDVIVIEDDSPPSSVKTDSEPLAGAQPTDAVHTGEQTGGKRKSDSDLSVNPAAKAMKGTSGEKLVQPPSVHAIPSSASANTLLGVFESAVALTLQGGEPKAFEKQIAQRMGTEKQRSAAGPPVSHINRADDNLHADPTRNIFNVFTSSSSITTQSSSQSKADYSESEQPLALTVKPSSTTTTSNYKKKRWNIDALKQMGGGTAENPSQIGHTGEVSKPVDLHKAPGGDSGLLSTAQFTSKLDLPSSQSTQRQLTKSPEVPLKPIKPKQQWAHSRKLKEVEALQKDAEWQAGPCERSSVRQSKSLATAIIKSVIEDEEITSGKYKSSDPKVPKLPKKTKPKTEPAEKKHPKPKEPQPSTSKVKEDDFSDFSEDDDEDFDDDLEDFRRGKISEIVPDVDDIEGMLFMSFCSKDALHAHVAVEEKTRQEMGDKGREFLMDITKFKTLNLPPKTKRKLKEIGQAELFRHKGKHGMRGIHNRIRKYERMLKLELKALKTNKTQQDAAPIETVEQQGEPIPEEKSPEASKVKTPGSGKKIKKATTPANKTGTPAKKKKKAVAQEEGKGKSPDGKSGKKGKKPITVPQKDNMPGDDSMPAGTVMKEEASLADETKVKTEVEMLPQSSSVSETDAQKAEKTPEKFLSKKGKTTDPTKIKGYKKKKKQKALTGEDIELLENTPFEKLHWKTQERLLSCMTEEQIKDRGLQAQVVRMKERKTEGFIPKKLRTKKRMKELEQSRSLEASTSGLSTMGEGGEEEQEIIDDDSTDIYNFYGDDDDDDLENPEEIEQQAEQSPSPSVGENLTKMGPELIGPAREEAGCKKSAFVSDELEKYLATEGEIFGSKSSKVTFTHPLMHNKAENVAFQTPLKQASFVKTLDSVIQKGNFIKGTGQKAKSPLQHGTQIRIVNSKMVNRKPALLSKPLKAVPKKTSSTGPKSALSKLKASLMKSHPTARRASTTTASDVTVVSPTQAASAASALDESFETGQDQSAADSNQSGESTIRKAKVLKTVKEPMYQLSSPRREEEFQEKPACNNNFCRLGCVCDSIKDTGDASSEKEHCGKVDCMFGCVCTDEERAESRRRPRRPSESSMMYFDSADQDCSPAATKQLQPDSLDPQEGGKIKSAKNRRTAGKKKSGGQQKSKDCTNDEASEKESDNASTSTSTDGREKRKKPGGKGDNMQPKKKRMVKRKPKSESSEGMAAASSKTSKIISKESEDGIKEQDISEDGFLEDRFMDEDEEDALFIDDIGLDDMDDDEREEEDEDDGMTCARTRHYQSKVCQRKCMCKQHGNSTEEERCEAEKEWSKIRAEIERRKAKEQKPGAGVTVTPNRKVQPYREFVYVGPRPPPPDVSPTARLPRLAPAPPPPPPPVAPPTSAPAAAGAKSASGGKLIEIISDCNWESAKANILQTIAQHSQRNDGPRVMRVGNFLIEIMQPNPQGKLPIPAVPGAGPPPAGMRFPVPTAVALGPQGPARILPSSSMSGSLPQTVMSAGGQVSAVPSVGAIGTAAADASQAATTAIVGKVALVQGTSTDSSLISSALPNTSNPSASKSPVLLPIPRALTSPVQNCTVPPTQDAKEVLSPSGEKPQSGDEAINMQEPPSLKRQPCPEPSISSSTSASQGEEHPLAALRSLADSPFGTASTTVTVTSSPMGSAATSQTCHSSFSTTSPKCSVIENPRCRSRNDSGDTIIDNSLEQSDSSGQANTASNSRQENSEVSPSKDPSSLPELVPRPQTPPAPPEKRYSPSMPVLEPITPPRPMRDGDKSKVGLTYIEADTIVPHKPFAREPATSSVSLEPMKEISDGVKFVNSFLSIEKTDSVEFPKSQGCQETQEQCTEITSTSNQGEEYVEGDLENNNDLGWDTNQATSLHNEKSENSQCSEDANDSKLCVTEPTEEEKVTQPAVKDLTNSLVEGEQQDDISASNNLLPSDSRESDDTTDLNQPSISEEAENFEDLEIDIESLEDTEGSQSDFLKLSENQEYSMPINPKCTLHNLVVKKKRKSPLKEKEVKADEVQFHEGALPPEPDEDEEALHREGPMRLIHKANERRRRSEMKDLFDKMKSVLGYDEEYKMSKYAVLKETVEEIGNLLEEERELMVQKHQERQTFEQFAEKMSKITGQEMEDILKTYWTADLSIWTDAKEPPPPVVRPKPPPPAPKLEFMPSSKPGSGSESGDRQDRPSRPSSTSSSSGSRPGTPTGSLQKGRADSFRTLRKVSTTAALQVQSGKVKPFSVTKPPQSLTPPHVAERSKPLILKTKPNSKNNKVATCSPGAQLVTGNIMSQVANGQPVAIPVATVMPQLAPSVKPTVTPVIISVQSLAVSSSQSSGAAQASSSSAPVRTMTASTPIHPVVPCVQVPGVAQSAHLPSQPGTMIGVMQPVAQVQPNNSAVQPNQPMSGLSVTSMSSSHQGQGNVSSSLSQTVPNRQLGTFPPQQNQPQQGSPAFSYKPPVGNQTAAAVGNHTIPSSAKQSVMSSDMGTASQNAPPVAVVSASQAGAGSQGQVSGFSPVMTATGGPLQPPRNPNIQATNPSQGQGSLNNMATGQIVTLAGKPGQFLVTPVSGPQGALLLQPIGRIPVSHGMAAGMQNPVTTTSSQPTGQGFASQMATSPVQLQQGQPIPHSLVQVSGSQPVHLNSQLTAAHSGIQLVALQRLPINLSQPNVSVSSQPVYLQVSPTLSNIQTAGNPLQTTVTSPTLQQLSPLSPTAVRPLQLMASAVPQAGISQASPQGITNLPTSQMNQAGNHFSHPSSFVRGPPPQMSPGMQTSRQGSVSMANSPIPIRPVLPTLSTPNSPFQHSQSYQHSPSQQATSAFQPDGSSPRGQVPVPSQNSTSQYLSQTAPSAVSSPGVDILSAAVCEAGLQSDFVDPQPPTATQQAASAPPSTELSTLSTVNVELLMPADQTGDSSSSPPGPGTYTESDAGFCKKESPRMSSK